MSKSYIPVPEPSVMPTRILENIAKGFVFVEERRKAFNEFQSEGGLPLWIDKLTKEIEIFDKHLSDIAISCACECVPFSWRKDYEAGFVLFEEMKAKLTQLRLLRDNVEHSSTCECWACRGINV
jgi:hypothetical protein